VEYLKALQIPSSSLGEPVLQSCLVDCNQMGQPKSWAGSNAIVFRLRLPDGPILALRCFTQKVPDVEARYRAYSDFYKQAPKGLKSALVRVNYLAKGIQVGGAAEKLWQPAIVMTWANGQHLGAWVESHRGDKAKLSWLQRKLGELAAQMASAQFIHGDLQHRNIVVGEGGPVLVDYDSVLLPNAKGLKLTTWGLAAFRHPRAIAGTPPEALDRFAFLVLHVGLEALIQKPSLYDRWGKVEGLLFQGSDLKNPGASPLFQALRGCPELAGMAQALASVCRSDPSKTPELSAFLAMIGNVGPIHSLVVGQPAWNPLRLRTLDQLYATNPKEPNLRVHRIEVQGPYAQETQRLQSQSAPLARHVVGVPPMLQSSMRLVRSRWRPLLWGLFLAGSLLLAWRPVHAFVSGLPAEGQGAVRKELQARLEAKKDQLLPLIIGMDEELEVVRTLPEDLRLAKLNPSNGEVDVMTAAQLRRNLSQSREQARQALIRCDDLLGEFDALLSDPALTPQERVLRMASIQDLPPDIQERVKRGLMMGKNP
jgi:hypothetical protein